MSSSVSPLAFEAASGTEEEEHPVDGRRYANALFQVNEVLNKRIPALEERVDETHGIALAAHGLASEIRNRVEDIAKAVKAPASSAIAIARASLPPPPVERLEIEYKPSPTGTHAIVQHDELERLKKKFEEQEAEKRGYSAALKEKLEEEELGRKRAKEKRDFWLFVAAMIGTAGGGIAYALAHFVFKG